MPEKIITLDNLEVFKNRLETEIDNSLAEVAKTGDYNDLENIPYLDDELVTA